MGLTLCSTGDADLQRMNPCLSPELVQTSRDLTFAIMLHVNRLSHLSRCQSMAEDLQRALAALGPTTTTTTTTGAGSDSADDARREIRLRASLLATALMTERHCVRADSRQGASPGGVRFDPRFLTFEFINNLVMRKQQHQLVTRFLKAAASGDSLCHQMIMGAGKTTGACRGVMVSPRVRGRAKVRVYENRRHPNSPCCPICSPDACGRCSVSHTSLASFEGVPYWVQSGNPRPEFGSP